MSKKGGKWGGRISNPKNFIAILRKLTHIYELSRKKRNEESKNEGGDSVYIWLWTRGPTHQLFVQMSDCLSKIRVHSCLSEWNPRQNESKKCIIAMHVLLLSLGMKEQSFSAVSWFKLTSGSYVCQRFGHRKDQLWKMIKEQMWLKSARFS